MRYEARAPLRIDFAGGWSDIPIFAEAEGGAVLNAAITRYATGFISRPETANVPGIAGPSMAGSLLSKLRGDRSYVSYTLDLPVGAGLGASAAQMVLWATLVKTPIANVSDRCQIAEIACELAKLMGILGGKQDEYAAALGGINFLTFGDSVRAERLSVDTSFLDTLRSRLVLVYTGESRLSSDIHEGVWERYRSGEHVVVEALRRLAEIATEMKTAMLAGDAESFAGLMNENWSSQKALHPSVTNERIEEIMDLAMRNGGIAGKACGAGGGGCLILVSAENRGQELRQALAGARVQVIDFDFDTYGVHLKKC
jgi:D-glycero-alpha-D-manno-heptose-7-phosphate kinase